MERNGLSVLGSVRMEVTKWGEENRELTDQNGLGVLGPVRIELDIW